MWTKYVKCAGSIKYANDVWERKRFILTVIIREAFLVDLKFELNHKDQEGLQQMKIVERGSLGVMPAERKSAARFQKMSKDSKAQKESSH